MGKSKEKILKKMNTAVYDLKDADHTYLVVSGGLPYGKSKLNNLLQFLDGWLSCITSKDHVVDVVYWMNTRNEVLVGVNKSLDIHSILGAHKWKRFCPVIPGVREDILVFEYNYPMKGPPERQQWREEYTPSADKPKGFFQDPYPTPSYAERPSNIRDIALPLPIGLRSPSPPPEPSQGHQDGPMPPASIPKGSKLDPYEQEAHAAQSLHSLNVKAEQTASESADIDRRLRENFDIYQRSLAAPNAADALAAKKEETSDEVSQALRENFEALQRSTGSIRLPEVTKEEPSDEISRRLEEQFNILYSQGPQASAKTEDSDPRGSSAAPRIKSELPEELRGVSPKNAEPTVPATSGSRVKEGPVDVMAMVKRAQAAAKARQQTNTMVKAESVEETISSRNSFSRLPNVKREPVDQASAPMSKDPRSQNRPTVSSFAKRRQGETSDGSYKRVKME